MVTEALKLVQDNVNQNKALTTTNTTTNNNNNNDTTTSTNNNANNNNFKFRCSLLISF